jgi:hypothetical protein
MQEHRLRLKGAQIRQLLFGRLERHRGLRSEMETVASVPISSQLSSPDTKSASVVLNSPVVSYIGITIDCRP